jgi:hypothetical protein
MITNILNECGGFILKYFKFIVLGILAISCISFIVLISSSKLNINTQLVKRIDEYYMSWQNYDRVNGKDLHDLWNKKYHDAQYMLNGDAKYNQYDCTSAVYWFLRDFGANFELYNVRELYRRLEFVSKKRNYYKDVKVGDIIIICIKGTNWHVGLVEGKDKGLIKYMAMEVSSIGASYKQTTFTNNIVKGIYSVTFELWIGDLLKNIKTTQDLHIIIKSQEIEEVKKNSEVLQSKEQVKQKENMSTSQVVKEIENKNVQILELKEDKI